MGKNCSRHCDERAHVKASMSCSRVHLLQGSLEQRHARLHVCIHTDSYNIHMMINTSSWAQLIIICNAMGCLARSDTLYMCHSTVSGRALIWVKLDTLRTDQLSHPVKLRLIGWPIHYMYTADLAAKLALQAHLEAHAYDLLWIRIESCIQLISGLYQIIYIS